MLNILRNYIRHFISNNAEVINNFSDKRDLFFILDEKDKNHYENSVLIPDSNRLYYDLADMSYTVNKLNEKRFSKYANNIIIFTDSIGVSPADITKSFNLLTIEDEVIVLGKSTKGKISLIGFNDFNNELFASLEWDNLIFDEVLANVSKHENLVHVLNNFISVNDLDDFKNLYNELSKKESLAYCSQEMHEKFTNIFIEYKDLLK